MNQKTVQAIPDGMQCLTAYLIYDDASDAITFYKKVFKAVEG